MVEREALPISEEEIREVRDLAISGDFEQGRGSVKAWDARPAYYDKIASLVSLARPIKVWSTLAMAWPVCSHRRCCVGWAARWWSCTPEPDSTFPNHLPDPEKEENMLDLMKLVPEVGAEVGFAWDGDGDRLGVCDERGYRWEADFINILLARDLLTRHPGSTVLLDLKSSLNTLADVEAHGGKPQLWKTGHSFMKRKMKEDGILLGGELSGHMFVGEGYLPIDDALIAAGRVIERADALGAATFAAVRGDAPTLRHAPDPVALSGRSEVRGGASDPRPALGEVPGHRHRWRAGRLRRRLGLVRNSNTSPALTARCEATTPEGLKRIMAEMKALLDAQPSVDMSAWPSE